MEREQKIQACNEIAKTPRPMKTSRTLTALFALQLGGVIHFAAVAAPAPVNWPPFRGPNGSDVADDGRPPIRFSGNTNLLWAVVVPSGISAPWSGVTGGF